MRRLLLLGPVLLLATVVLAGCGGNGDDNPFVGSWLSATQGRLTFGEDTWSDTDGDGGTYSYTGDHPVYEVTFVSGTQTTLARATFLDTFTLELCPRLADGRLGLCDELALDKPTLH